ncbi:MAG: M15 family metallopeptidase [Bacilli bacterium]|nr:M15 family metallopeptidase [Bacilli bacterium]
MAKKKKLRIRVRAIEILCYILIAIFTTKYAISHGIEIHKNYEYQKTDEYKLILKGYKETEAVEFIKTLNQEQINYLLEQDYNEDYSKIILSKYFKPQYLNSYIEYKLYHRKVTIEDTIAIVNTHANVGWYNEEYTSQNYNEYLVIANKFYKLPEDYHRDDIIPISLAYSYNGNKASKVVIEAFEEMYNDIKSELGVRLMINSSYRSYEWQEQIYNSFLRTSIQYADSHAARPGHSEHQTGLVLNISSIENPNETFDTSEEFEWLKNNSYKYGFIQRYPEDKKHITGFNETWLFRYVTPEVAKIIHDEGITFDEYYAYYIEK